MDVLRTPDERFDGLPEFPFAPRYVEIGDGEGGTLRVHHLDEGPADGPPVLLLHGDPTWSYLYRRVIPTLVDAGLRCIAPDLVGMGRSDKPAAVEDHTYARHVAWMDEVVFEQLDLRDITFVGQDWGGMIGLRLVASRPERFARVVASNTWLLTGNETLPPTLYAWLRYARDSPVPPIGAALGTGTAHGVEPAVVAAYEAPFPDERYQAALRAFPPLIPTTPDDPAVPDNLAAWEALEQFDRPFLCVYGALGPITQGFERPFIERVPGAAGQPHTLVEDAGHFLPEDASPELADRIIRFVTDAG